MDLGVKFHHANLTCPQIGKKLGLRLPNRIMHGQHHVSSEDSGKRLMAVNGLCGILLFSGGIAIPACNLRIFHLALGKRAQVGRVMFRSVEDIVAIDGVGVMFDWRS